MIPSDGDRLSGPGEAAPGLSLSGGPLQILARIPQLMTTKQYLGFDLTALRHAVPRTLLRRIDTVERSLNSAGTGPVNRSRLPVLWRRWTPIAAGFRRKSLRRCRRAQF